MRILFFKINKAGMNGLQNKVISVSIPTKYLCIKVIRREIYPLNFFCVKYIAFSSSLKNIRYVFFYFNMICKLSRNTFLKIIVYKKVIVLIFFVTEKVFSIKILTFYLICAWSWTLKWSIQKNCSIEFESHWGSRTSRASPRWKFTTDLVPRQYRRRIFSTGAPLA